MRHSLLWTVSVLVSAAAHYGLIAAAANIRLADKPEAQHAEIVLGGAVFDPVSVDAGTVAAVLDQTVSSAEIGELKPDAATVQSVAGGLHAEAVPQSAVLDQAVSSSEIGKLKPDSMAEIGKLEPDAATVQSAAGGLDTEAVPQAATLLAPDSPPDVVEQAVANTAVPPTENSSLAASSAAADLAPLQQAELGLLAAAPPDFPVVAGGIAVIEPGTQPPATMPAISRPSPELRAESGGLPAVESPAAPPPSGPIAELTEDIPPAAPSGAMQQAAPDAAAIAPQSSAPATGKTIASVIPSAPVAEIAPEPDQPTTLQENTQIASAATSAAQAMSQAEKAASFIANYPRGNCVLAAASVTGSGAPRVSGLGGDGAPIAEFAAAFRQSVGVDPVLELERIRGAQCPAVDFILAMGGPSPRMRVVLDRTGIPDGEMLIGHIDNLPRGSFSLLLVDDSGAVRDISSEFHFKPGGNFFGIGVMLLGGGKGRNQLVLAVSSPRPLEFSVTRKPGEAAALFQAIGARAAAGNIPVETAYAAFRIE